jgi:hypothetical protein
VSLPGGPTVPRADQGALAVLAEYIAARGRGEYRVLKLPGADLRDADLSGLDLEESDLTGAVLDGARLTEARLARSCLAGASLIGVDFSYADLRKADMDSSDATAASFVGAMLQNTILTRTRLRRADMSEADVSRANLQGSDLTDANLSRAIAIRTNLHGVILESAVLTGLRGEPFFDAATGRAPAEGSFGWPAARLTEVQLVELAESYLSTQGWGIGEPLAARDATDARIDLIAQRDGEVILAQVKATTTPSSQVFSRFVEQLKRLGANLPSAHLILVMPGPIPEGLREVAIASRIGVLSVWADQSSINIEEVVRPDGDSLATSA